MRRGSMASAPSCTIARPVPRAWYLRLRTSVLLVIGCGFGGSQATYQLMNTDRPLSTVIYAEDLVRRVRASDPLAFDELYARYSPRVFGYLFQRLNGNAEEA